jgi:quinoprotein glucose dehydrogenase
VSSGSPLAALLAALCLLGSAQAQDEPGGHPSTGGQTSSDDAYAPRVEPASDDWRAALAAMTVPDGHEVSLWAAEPLLANPVCLRIADDGKLYVGETFRHTAGVTDIRDHWDWLDDDLAARTVQDRVDYMAKHTGEDFDDYAREHDRIRLLRDTDGDGRADLATVFADGFKDHATGIGAGVLEHDGAVYYACIPHLWKLVDRDGDGVAERRDVLSSGYGVHTGLLGHDLHGLRMGPDGRLYFSMGDRGFHVETPQGLIDHGHTGAVLRCEPDGSDLTVFHTGLRNPQDLVFDDLGELFTGDNNSDGGDEARWVHCVPGGDSAWRFSYQWIDRPTSRGPWNDEQLWHPRHPRQATWHLPPIINIANGPSGITYNPGTSLGPDLDRHFFLTDFLGGTKWSGIHTFVMEPDGAGWRMDRERRFLWDVLVTDAEFGPDGGLYLTDWVDGWQVTGKGRVWVLRDSEHGRSELVKETERVLGEGMDGREVDELAALLGHPDQRVRQAAHFALADRGEDGVDELVDAARGSSNLHARLAGIWGLWIAGRRDADVLDPLLGLARDGDDEVRAQALRVLGDLAWRPARAVVMAGLSDPAPRARFYASLAAGSLGLEQAVPALLEVVKDAGVRDPTLRHGAVQGLIGCADGAALMAFAEHESPHVRTAVVLALRQLRSPLLAGLLSRLERSDDPEDAWVALEAARAIHDLPVPTATASLAAALTPEAPLLTRFLTDDELPTAAYVRRAMAANLALGMAHHARRVADLAATPEAPADLRAEALRLLARWDDPAPRDLVMGDWRPHGPRDAPFLPELAQRLADGGLDDAPAEVRLAYLELLDVVDGASHGPLLTRWLEDDGLDAEVRSGALERLVDQSAPGVDELLSTALTDPDGELRATALGLLRLREPAEAAAFLPTILAVGEIAERRSAYRILSARGVDEALVAEHLDAELERLAAGLVSPELHLDLVLAAEAAGRQDALAARHAAAEDVAPELVPWLDGLFGGDVDRGREVFERTALSCQRCHARDESTGFRVGPELAGVGQRRTRLELMTSVVDPNASLAPGYEASNLFLVGGGVLSGRVVAEDDTTLTLLDSEGVVTEVALADVDERRVGLSAMPEEMAATLDRKEMRDLVAYLASL